MDPIEPISHVADKSFSSDGPRCLCARAVVRRMRGATRADLVSTDGGLYIVKWKQNPVNRRVLINALIGTELLRRMHIPAPEWALIDASTEFCREQTQISGLQPGLHFGLARPGDPSASSLYDYLPYTLSARILNRPDFVRTMVLDCWLDNTHRRESIFTPVSAGYYGQMIGSGHVLGFRGGSWSLSSRPELHLPLPVSPSVYLSATAAGQIDLSIAQIQQMAAPVLDMIGTLIPDDWLGSDHSELSSVFHNLLERTALLPEFTRRWLTQLRHSQHHD